MSDILMPALSPTMETGKLAKWHVAVGDTVKAGDVLADIETDKATMELEATDDGVIGEIVVAAGDEEVEINAVLARLRSGGVTAPKVAPAAAPPPAPAAEPPTPPLAAATPAPAAPDRLFATPLARRLAGLVGLDLGKIHGSGPRGRIVKADVEAASGRARPQPAPVAATQPQAPQPSLAQQGVAPGGYDLVPLDGMRRTIARRMADSFRDTPHFPLTIDVELDALLAVRAELNAALAPQGVKVSVNDFVIRASARALMATPAANASYTPDGIAMHRHADIAVAVAVDGGLITPIVRAAETKGLAAIAVEMRQLAERARSKALKPEEFTGGTFSISNLGMFGIRSFSSILNAPQGAILSVGAGEARPVVRDGELAIATVMTVTLTCDHRAMDGAAGAGFLASFKAALETPLLLMA